jgi:2,3-dihydroxy-2,3-dihydrophenylpropionate dehydrogenase
MGIELKGKVAAITGGASGIGRAVAERMAAGGAKVCVLDRSGENLQTLAKRLGGNCAVLQGDVTRYEDHVRLVDLAVNTFGKLDILVANAGIFDGFASIREIPEEILDKAFDEIMHVNVKGYLFAARAALAELGKTNGNMIFTVSNAGFYPNGGGPIYTASKHAIVGLIRELAFELAPEIRVNGVAPGGTLTNIGVAPSLKPYAKNATDPKVKEGVIKSRNPLQLAYHSEDHVEAYMLLASEHSRAITGTVIESDGGIGIRGMPVQQPK